MLISIIVPSYNVEKYLMRCLESINNQTFDDYEVILIDDGSTDSTGDICEQYCMNHPKFRVVHKQNEGLGYARNTGLEYAKGEYICFIDSDDYIEKDMLKNLYECLKANNADTCIGGFKRVFSDRTGNQYEKAVTLLNSLGILNGYPDGTFRPDNSITRAEFTVIANKLANLTAVKSSGIFTDCDLHWAKSYIETAAKNNILSGYPDGTFRPDNLVTYSEGVTILLNMRGYKEEINKSTFIWPYNYLNKAKSVGLLNAIEKDNYSTPANRGDVAIMALNAYLMAH